MKIIPYIYTHFFGIIAIETDLKVQLQNVNSSNSKAKVDITSSLLVISVMF